jgi:hypothetical protein
MRGLVVIATSSVDSSSTGQESRHLSGTSIYCAGAMRSSLLLMATQLLDS